MKSLQQRFDEKYFIEPNTGCWIWTGSLDKGYGKIVVGKTAAGNPRPIPASRLSYELHKGSPAGRVVCHKCDTPACVNPDHLFLGSYKDNSRDMVKKGRCKAGWQNKEKTHCSNGHEFTSDNTHIKKDGTRRCKECNRVRARAFQRKKKNINKDKFREYRIKTKENK